jgi:hypothetical protein
MDFLVELLTLPAVALALPGLAHARDGGAASQTQVADKAAIAGEAATVEGMVLARGSRQGAKGRQVFMKGRAPVTIRDGGFSFANVTSPYEVIVAEPSGDTISIYQGLTRRDPVLWFHTGYTSASHDSPHRATIHGILRGDFPFPVERNHGVTVHFLSDRAQSFWRADPPEQHTNSAGPRFGRMRVSWEGAPTMPGQLVAVGQHAVDKKKWVDAYVGRAPLTLTAEEEAIQEVTMQPVAIGRIAGSVSIDNHDMVREIGFGYQLPGMSGRVGLGTCPVYKTFDCELPLLARHGRAQVQAHGKGCSCPCPAAGSRGQTRGAEVTSAGYRGIGIERCRGRRLGLRAGFRLGAAALAMLEGRFISSRRAADSRPRRALAFRRGVRHRPRELVLSQQDGRCVLALA